MNVPLVARDEPGSLAAKVLEAEPFAKQAPEPKRGIRDIRVLVVDDHQVVRVSLAELLNRQQGLVVVGQAGDGAQAVEQAEALRPDAIIMDIEMPNLNGIEATRRIKQRHAEITVIGLTLREQGPSSRAMAEAGADGCLSKQASVRDMIDAIRQICRRDPVST